MKTEELVLVQGLRDTRAALEGWQAAGWRVLRTWLLGSLAISLGLLVAVLAIARLSLPDPSGLILPGVTRPASVEDVGFVLYRNGLVLALHAMACVAGFIAGSSLPLSASNRHGLSRWVHEKAGPLAIAFVVAATTFSLLTQAYALGGGASTLAAQLGVSPALLLLALLPHALPELVVLFLPLAAWLVASRSGQWRELLAATFVTVAVAVPVLVVSAGVEVFLTPRLLLAISG